MIDLFCNIYSSIQDKNAFLKRVRFYSLLRVITRLGANVILPLYFRSRQHKKKYSLFPKEDSHTPVIVSLTSFPARINRVWLVIECMLHQTYKPDGIILWLSKEQFRDMQSIPENLLRLQSRGLEIRIEEGDLRSHKKYTYVMRQYPEACIITIDDDIFYRSSLVGELMAQHITYPEAIIARYTHNMRYEADGTLASYNEWDDNVLVGAHLFFGSGGGTLLPPHTMHPDVINSTLATRICPNADDIWLNAMARIQKTPIIHTSNKDILLPIMLYRNIALFDTNETGGNDKQIKQLIDYCIQQYGVNPFAQSFTSSK